MLCVSRRSPSWLAIRDCLTCPTTDRLCPLHTHIFYLLASRWLFISSLGALFIHMSRLPRSVAIQSYQPSHIYRRQWTKYQNEHKRDLSLGLRDIVAYSLDPQLLLDSCDRPLPTINDPNFDPQKESLVLAKGSLPRFIKQVRTWLLVR